ncbi:outer membrane beta-barrel protein [Chryseolinea lacunae]|uniref:Outer membrane beta-barrel protein n=1 Tax=Chryseolinea lacunae TaxID=2801331 RepID=A0ABS1KWH4_9BACT|nr:outer membrane beta-barrel protein [Chryseolinea lacunae]MBL0743815.1 outer membrane beta-barrel protein [Chryseolinea lacunae]
MNDMERRKFEDAVKDAFSGAEANPSESVWTNLELELEKADGDKMRRRIVFYKLLAAASIAFAMAVAGVGYYAMQSSAVGPGIAFNQPTPPATNDGVTNENTLREGYQTTDNENPASMNSDATVTGAYPKSDEATSEALKTGDVRDIDVLIAQAHTPEADHKRQAINGKESNGSTSVEGSNEAQLAYARGNTPSVEKSNGTADDANLVSLKDRTSNSASSNSLREGGDKASQLAYADKDRAALNGNNGNSEQGNASPVKSTSNATALTGDGAESTQLAHNESNKVSGAKEADGKITSGTLVKATPSVSKASNSESSIALNNVDKNSDNQIINHGSVINPSASAKTENTTVAFADRALPPFYKGKTPVLKFPDNTPDPGQLLLARLAAEEKAYAEEDKKDDKKRSERLWTAVGFAAGGFNSINSSVTPPQTFSSSLAASSNAADNSNVADKQAKASGVSYSFGVSLGAKLSNRWVLQGGVNYLTQSSNYTANTVVASDNFQSLKAESINSWGDVTQQSADASSRTGDKIAPTFPYAVNNSVRFMSVPLQAGYLVVNRKFGLQVNAGVSTDLFLQNTITPEGGSLDQTTQGRGEDSPYRSVNFSGLMGTEFSYKFGQRYRLALNPGLRYPLNSVYKSDLGIQSTPLTFDVGLRFRYIFH